MIKRRTARDVIYNHRPQRVAVVDGSAGAVPLLPRGVPDLSLDLLPTVQFNDLGPELDADRRGAVHRERAFGESVEQTGFPDIAVPNKSN